MFGKMSRKSLASVVLPLEEQPLIPTMMAFWWAILDLMFSLVFVKRACNGSR